MNVSQCATLAPHGTCSISYTAPSNAHQAQYVINLKYKDNTNQRILTTSNVVSFSDAIPVSDSGIRYAISNNTTYNEPGGSTTMTVPFQLTKNFSSLTATSLNSNPAFAPTISCPGNQFTTGSLCNLYIRISNTGTNSILNGNIQVQGNSTVSLKTSLKTSLNKSLQSTTGFLFNVPVTVTQNQMGNLLTSAINVQVNPANGSSPQTITLLNNGTATVSNISIIGATPITLSSNTCSSLIAGASCTFNVNVNSTTSGQSTVSVTYNNGASSGNTNGQLTFNVVYISASSLPGLSLTSGQGNVLNQAINTTT